MTGPLAADTGFSFADPFAVGLLFIGFAVFAAVGALSHQHERAFSASLIYLVLGCGAAVVLHLSGVEWVDPVADAGPIDHLTEIAVIVALFSAGLKLDRPLTWRAWGSTARLLLIAMPVTIGLVALLGSQLLGLSAAAALLLGACLAPTDPVLAGDIGVGPPGDEDEHEPNFALTSEAGLNDGLAFPFVLAGIYMAAESRLGLGRGMARRRRRLRDRRAAPRSAPRSGWSRRGASSACATASCSRRRSTPTTRSPPCS